MISNKIKLFPLLALPLTTYTNISLAECARDDVEFYLNKGFTPEQITSLCKFSADKPATETEEAPQKTSYSAPDAAPVTSANKDEQFLKDAINGRNISLSDNSLQYTLKTCYAYAEEDQYGFAPKACPTVKYTIALRDLEVTRSGRKYIFFGASEIEVKGTIAREITGGLKDYKPEEQKQIHKHLESGNETIIPIRDDISPKSVEQTLHRLAI
ncbi:MAG: hypothetical protein OQK69_02955 [Gammaproteobacteria bacterium]|nr:hypothetical protein [Gammaproteobacteria bacterium]